MAIELTLDIDAIHAAIKDYVAKQGMNTQNKRVEVTILNGRGTTKNRAVVVISDTPLKTQEEIIDEAFDNFDEPEEVVEVVETPASETPNINEDVTETSDDNEDDSLFPTDKPHVDTKTLF